MNEARDEIARVMDVVVETRGRWSLLQDDIESRVPMPEFDQMLAEALFAAGFVVPSGLTAFELREIATWLTIRDPIDAADAAILAEMQTELREWADALDAQYGGGRGER